MSVELHPLTGTDIVRELAQECAAAGSQAAWARKRGISATHVNEVLNGRRDLTDSIANALGYSRVTRYVRVRHPAKVAA